MPLVHFVCPVQCRSPDWAVAGWLAGRVVRFAISTLCMLLQSLPFLHGCVHRVNAVVSELRKATKEQGLREMCVRLVATRDR